MFAIATLAHVVGRAVATVNETGAYLNACMPDDTRVRMRVSAFVTEVVVQLDPSCSEARIGIGQGVVRANEISSVMVSADV